MNISLFYDPQEFPQAQHYAECFGIYSENLDYKLRFKELNPVRHDYTKIYFAVKDRSRYQAIIDSHARFDCEFVEFIPDYRKTTWEKKMDYFWSVGLKTPFSDVAVMQAKKAKKAQQAKDEKAGKFTDPNAGEALDPKTITGLPNLKRRK